MSHPLVGWVQMPVEAEVHQNQLAQLLPDEAGAQFYTLHIFLFIPYLNIRFQS
jgi:hypothetical protein